MCSGHTGHTPLVQSIQNGDCQRRSLSGVGACTQLIKEHQSVGICILHNVHNVRHVGGEGAETLLNALFVPDVGVDILIHTGSTALPDRDKQPGLHHEVQ